MRGSGGPDDELDAVLDDDIDARTGRYADELEPMVGAARLLKEALLEHELGPEVAARHIQMALDRAERVPGRERPRRRRGRRAPARVAVTVLLAATLLLAMTAVASGGALPGQVLYPVKRTVEQVELSMAISRSAKADTRLRVAHTRLTELRALTARDDVRRVPGAIDAMQTAFRKADLAVAHTGKSGAGKAKDLRSRSVRLQHEMTAQLMVLAAQPPPSSSSAQANVAASTAAAAVLHSWGVAAPLPRHSGPDPGPPPAGAPSPASPASPAPGVPPTTTTGVPPSTVGAPLPPPAAPPTTTTTVPPSTVGAPSPTTGVPPTTTTTVPPSTVGAPSPTTGVPPPTSTTMVPPSTSAEPSTTTTVPPPTTGAPPQPSAGKE